MEAHTEESVESPNMAQIVQISPPPIQPQADKRLEQEPSHEIPKAKKKKTLTPIFTDEQEVELAEWYCEHEIFYNKRLKAYKNTQKKQALLEEKAAAMRPPCTAAQLKLFFSNMRTRFGKLTCTKSGQGTPDTFTERDQHIYNTFRYLDTHIRRVPSRQSAQFTEPSQNKASNSAADDDSVDQVSGDYDDCISDIDSDISSAISTFRSFTKNDGKLNIRPKDTAALVEKLIKRADQTAEERKRLMNNTHKNKQELTVQQFCAYLSTQLLEINPELWFEFTMDAQRMVYDYITRSKQPGHMPVYAYPPQQSHQQQQSQPTMRWPINNPASTFTLTPLQTVPKPSGAAYAHQQYQPQLTPTSTESTATSTPNSAHAPSIVLAINFSSPYFD